MQKTDQEKEKRRSCEQQEKMVENHDTAPGNASKGTIKQGD